MMFFPRKNGKLDIGRPVYLCLECARIAQSLRYEKAKASN